MSKKSTTGKSGKLINVLKFLAALFVILALVVAVIIMFGVSIKSTVQFIQLQSYENKVMGTVTVAEYSGGTPAVGSQHRYKYKECHYVIEFDEKVSGYDKYEYSATNMITTKKYIGDRYIVLFDRIEEPVLIQEKDVATDGVILAIFMMLVLLSLVFRKPLIRKMSVINNKLDDIYFKMF